jgi:hypothetical protein
MVGNFIILEYWIRTEDGKKRSFFLLEESTRKPEGFREAISLGRRACSNSEAPGPGAIIISTLFFRQIIIHVVEYF